MVSQEGRARLRRSRPWAASMAASPRTRFADVTPYRSRLPVICIGNFTAGGGGKTPTAIAVAALLKQLGREARLPHPRLWRRRARGRCCVKQGRARRRSAMSRCCWPRPRRPWSRPIARHGAKAIEATRARASSSWMTGSRTRVSPRIYRWSWSMPPRASAMAWSCRQGRLRAPLDAQIARAVALVVIGDGGKGGEA